MGWMTWAPFQSKKTKEICKHLTETEEGKIFAFGCFNGLIAGIFGISFSRGIMMASENKSATTIVITLCVLIGIPIMLMRRRKGKKLLCSTKWAQEQGYTPDKI